LRESLDPLEARLASLGVLAPPTPVSRRAVPIIRDGLGIR